MNTACQQYSHPHHHPPGLLKTGTFVLFRCCPIPAAALLFLTLAGCQGQDEIRHYQVEREAPPRLLAAILPHGDRVWFFTAKGPAPVVGAHRKQFEEFLHSIKFTDSKEPPLTWKVPEGWHEEQVPAKGDALGLRRHGTFRFGPSATPVELTILPLPRVGQAASVLANVNRWRGQLGLRPVTETELEVITQRLKVGEETATLVDITAPDRAAAEEPPAPEPLTFKTPEGWKAKTPGAFAKLAFQVSRDGKNAEVTVSQLGGKGGGLVANINRWRGQLGLPAASNDQIHKDSKQIDIGGTKATYVQLLGPEAGGERKEILGAIVERQGGETWFFKMTGPAELVTGERATFEAFLQTVRFEGAGNHE
jgi:hypothetical protein